MKMTRERKAVIAVLGLALVALMVDRIIGPGDADPAAVQDAQPLLLVSATSGTRPAAPGDPATSSGTSLAERLRSAAPVGATESFGTMRDIFRPVTVAVVAPAPVKPADFDYVLAAQRFAQAHRLTSVTVGGQRSSAVVDGRLLQIGGRLDGFTLRSVSSRSATFEAGGIEVHLNVNAPDTSAAAR